MNKLLCLLIRSILSERAIISFIEYYISDVNDFLIGEAMMNILRIFTALGFYHGTPFLVKGYLCLVFFFRVLSCRRV